MKRSTAQSAAAVLLLTVLLAGCRNADRPDVNRTAPRNDSSADIKVPLRLASWEEVEQLVAAKQGQVVVLDVWSTWCAPCIREFPKLVALNRQYGDRVACISLNCNYTGAEGETPEDSRPEITTFLQDQGATFDNVLSTTPDEQLMAILDAAAVPIVRVYDKQGQLRKQFVNEDDEYGEEGFTYPDHIAPLVEQLLSE